VFFPARFLEVEIIFRMNICQEEATKPYKPQSSKPSESMIMAPITPLVFILLFGNKFDLSFFEDLFEAKETARAAYMSFITISKLSIVCRGS
jgi:hypothetical protein